MSKPLDQERSARPGTDLVAAQLDSEFLVQYRRVLRFIPLGYSASLDITAVIVTSISVLVTVIFNRYDTRSLFSLLGVLQ